MAIVCFALFFFYSGNWATFNNIFGQKERKKSAALRFLESFF